MDVEGMKVEVFEGNRRPDFREDRWRAIPRVREAVERGWSADIDSRPDLKTFEEALKSARDGLPSDPETGRCCAAS